eukprot:TRINITY_DN14271_c0_g1_i1.p1 TRINITY_DN14271_c0_g1~~TRINITY_DN14271_c0_g1_i1.p1  ORF type:complete len:241 (-),score=53.15 TRINITY_DN14271_c0_g1_i1:97-819(-)
MAMADLALPQEMIDHIFGFATTSPALVAKLGSVCRSWRDTLLGVANNEYWKEYAKKRWVFVDSEIAVENWYQWVSGRARQIADRNDDPLVGKAHPVVNCLEWKFKCPLVYEDLEDYTDDVRFCKSCEKHVYLVVDESELVSHVNAGHCVSYVPSFDRSEQWMGEMVAMPVLPPAETAVLSRADIDMFADFTYTPNPPSPPPAPAPAVTVTVSTTDAKQKAKRKVAEAQRKQKKDENCAVQ